MIIDGDAGLRGAELLDDNAFYKEGHRRLFRTLRTLVEHRTVIDYVTLREELQRRGELELAGGVEYLNELVNAVPTGANLEFHARILKDKAIQRRLIEAATQIITEAYDGKSTARELLDAAEGKIFLIGQQRRDEGFTRIKEMLWPTMEKIESLSRSGNTMTGVPSGFIDLDNLTTGFQPAELIIVAARPSMGKTAFCLNLATHAAVEGHGVAIFSLEMSKDALVQRMLCSEARVDSQAVRRGQVKDADFSRLAQGLGIPQAARQFGAVSPLKSCIETLARGRTRFVNSLGLLLQRPQALLGIG